MKSFKSLLAFAAGLMHLPPPATRRVDIADRLSAASAKHDWPTWLRLNMPYGRQLQRPDPNKDTSGSGARRYGQIERARKLRRKQHAPIRYDKQVKA